MGDDLFSPKLDFSINAAAFSKMKHVISRAYLQHQSKRKQPSPHVCSWDKPGLREQSETQQAHDERRRKASHVEDPEPSTKIGKC